MINASAASSSDSTRAVNRLLSGETAGIFPSRYGDSLSGTDISA